MVSANVNKVLEETKRWTVDERRQLVVLLRADDAEADCRNDALDALLIREGVIMAPPPKPTAEDAARNTAWQPVAIQGKPLSETIIEERR